MKTMISLLVIFSIINCIKAQSDAYVTPTDGPFFYSEYYYDKGKGYIRLQIGSDKDNVNLRFNSEELTLAVFTTNCTAGSEKLVGKPCNVPVAYEYIDDEYNNKNSSNTKLSNEKAYLW